MRLSGRRGRNKEVILAKKKIGFYNVPFFEEMVCHTDDLTGPDRLV